MQFKYHNIGYGKPMRSTKKQVNSYSWGALVVAKIIKKWIKKLENSFKKKIKT